jgi:hypothetical protein
VRVRARQKDYATAPGAVRPYLGQTLITPGRDYEVYAAAVFEGVVVTQVIDDGGLPGWKPGWLFEVVDQTVPVDWICSIFRDEPSLILGPAFVAGSVDQYNAMVELEPEQVETFWKHVEERGG